MSKTESEIKIKNGVKECRECGSFDQVIDRETVCRECGVIKDKQYVDELPYDSYEIGKTYEFAASLGSVIGNGSSVLKDASGSSLKKYNRYKFRRLRRRHEITSLQNHVNHIRTFDHYRQVLSNFNIPKNIVDRSKYLYWQYINDPNYDVTNRIMVIAACLVKAIREYDYPIKFKEIVNAFKQNGNKVSVRGLINFNKEVGINYGVAKSEDYINRIVSDVCMNEDIMSRVSDKYNLDDHRYKYILEKISIKFLSLLSMNDRGATNPFIFATSVVYMSDRLIGNYYNYKRYAALTRKLIGDEVSLTNHNTITSQISRILGDLYSKHEGTLKSYLTSILNKNEEVN